MCAFERYCDRHNPDPSPAADKRAATVSSAVPSCQNHKAIHKTSMIPKSGNCFSEKSCANTVDTARSPGSRPWSGERLDKAGEATPALSMMRNRRTPASPRHPPAVRCGHSIASPASRFLRQMTLASIGLAMPSGLSATAAGRASACSQNRRQPVALASSTKHANSTPPSASDTRAGMPTLWRSRDRPLDVFADLLN